MRELRVQGKSRLPKSHTQAVACSSSAAFNNYRTPSPIEAATVGDGVSDPHSGRAFSAQSPARRACVERLAGSPPGTMRRSPAAARTGRGGAASLRGERGVGRREARGDLGSGSRAGQRTNMEYTSVCDKSTPASPLTCNPATLQPLIWCS